MTRIEPAQMDDARLEAEIEHMRIFFDECAEAGQGISTKESVRMRRLVAERDARGFAMNVPTGCGAGGILSAAA